MAREAATSWHKLRSFPRMIGYALASTLYCLYDLSFVFAGVIGWTYAELPC